MVLTNGDARWQEICQAAEELIDSKVVSAVPSVNKHMGDVRRSMIALTLTGGDAPVGATGVDRESIRTYDSHTKKFRKKDRVVDQCEWWFDQIRTDAGVQTNGMCNDQLFYVALNFSPYLLAEKKKKRGDTVEKMMKRGNHKQLVPHAYKGLVHMAEQQEIDHWIGGTHGYINTVIPGKWSAANAADRIARLNGFLPVLKRNLRDSFSELKKKDSARFGPLMGDINARVDRAVFPVRATILGENDEEEVAVMMRSVAYEAVWSLLMPFKNAAQKTAVRERADVSSSLHRAMTPKPTPNLDKEPRALLELQHMRHTIIRAIHALRVVLASGGTIPGDPPIRKAINEAFSASPLDPAIADSLLLFVRRLANGANPAAETDIDNVFIKVLAGRTTPIRVPDLTVTPYPWPLIPDAASPPPNLDRDPLAIHMLKDMRHMIVRAIHALRRRRVAGRPVDAQAARDELTAAFAGNPLPTITVDLLTALQTLGNANGPDAAAESIIDTRLVSDLAARGFIVPRAAITANRWPPVLDVTVQLPPPPPPPPPPAPIPAPAPTGSGGHGKYHSSFNASPKHKSSTTSDADSMKASGASDGMISTLRRRMGASRKKIEKKDDHGHGGEKKDAGTAEAAH